MRPAPLRRQFLLLAVLTALPQRQSRHRLLPPLISDELGINENVMSWAGTSNSIGDPQQAVRASWELHSVEPGYAGFIAASAACAPSEDAEMFAAQIDLVPAGRRFPSSIQHLSFERDRATRWHMPQRIRLATS